MRRLRNDLPYTFRPPVRNSWVRPLGHAVNQHVHLRRKYQIAHIRDEGFDVVRKLVEAEHAVLLAPNHSDHADPHVLLEIGRRHDLQPFFMGAREIFEVSPVAGWSLQQMGVFSVDRDGPDLSAVKMAMQILDAGEEPLVMFPEGEIYHHHRRLDPLNEGVASILLKVAAKLAPPRKAYLVPVALRFFHDPSVETTFRDRLSRLEDRIGWIPKPNMPTDDRIRRLATGVLALKETEALGRANSGDIHQRLTRLCEDALDEVETRYSKDAKATTPPERVRALRYRIRRRLLDTANPPERTERDALLDDLDLVFTALQAHSYIGDYLTADNTLDRRAETLMKLEEDLFGFPNYPVPRRTEVTAGEPIPVSDLITDGSLPSKGGAIELTTILETKLSSLIA